MSDSNGYDSLDDDKQRGRGEERPGVSRPVQDVVRRQPIEVDSSLSEKKKIQKFIEHASKFSWDKADHCNKASDIFSNFDDILDPTKQSGVFIRLIAQEPDWDESKVKGFVGWLSKSRHRNLLISAKSSDDSRQTPLIIAIDDRWDSLVTALLQVDVFPVERMYKVNGYGTCLHQAIKKKSLSVELMVDKLKGWPHLYREVDKNGNNVLHLLAKTCGDELFESKLNLAIQPPAEAAGMDAHENMAATPDSEGVTKEAGTGFDSHTFRIRMLRNILDVIRPEIYDTLWQENDENGEKLTPYQVRVSTLKKSQEVIDILNRVSDPNRELTLQEKKLKNVIGLVGLQEQARRRIIDADPIATILREFCVRKLATPQNCSTALYKPGDERHIDFDLAGLPGDSISQDFLDTLVHHIHFETVLRYVALPHLVVKPSKRASKGGIVNQNGADSEVTDLRAIFSWLRRNGVKEIVRVTVIDYGDECHSDAAIEEALEGFEIKFWNWKKVNLSSQVIERCSMAVEEISLYWTGNYAVMMGWASAEGFSNAKKFPALRRIRLFVKEGYEKKAILEKQINRFKAQMALRIQQVTDEQVQDFLAKGVPTSSMNDTELDDEQTLDYSALPPTIGPLLKKNREQGFNHIIRVLEVFDNKQFSHARDFKSVDKQTEEGNRWIKTMEAFAEFLENAAKSHKDAGNKKVDPIKIAIIDDGVDATVPQLQSAIALGKSFSPYPNSTEFMRAYFVPSGRHGTLMATLIKKICPNAELYVARLEERPAEDGHRRYTAKSAKEAIEWARGCKVDIISMSWTISSREPHSQEIHDLKQEVTNASKDNILMFASASDKGEGTSEILFPAEEYNVCIRIGGASNEGDRLTWVNPKWVHFLLPGKEVGFLDHDTGSHFTETGSSLATACAAGLAGALLYSDRLLGVDRNLRQTSEMRKMFQGLSNKSTPPFIDVRKYLEQPFKSKLVELGLKQPGLLQQISELDWNGKSREALTQVLKDVWTHGNRP